jgi:hypothetical protein
VIEAKDGGPAFPAFPYPKGHNDEQAKIILQLGMSLRDYFAAAALQGLLAHEGHNHTWENARSVCNDALCIADVMLMEREKP